MKKFLILLLTLTLIISCVACSTSKAPSPSASPDDPGSSGGDDSNDTASPAPSDTPSDEPSSAPSVSPTDSGNQTGTEGLTIDLPDDFKADTYEGADYYYLSDTALFLAMQEDFDSLSSVEIDANSSLEEYAQAVINVNEVDAQVGTDSMGNVYFTYEQTVSGYDYFYYAVVKKGSEVFWLCQFACMATDAAEMTDSFAQWGSTIQVA